MGNTKTKPQAFKTKIDKRIENIIKTQIQVLVCGLELKIRKILLLIDQLNRNPRTSQVLEKYLERGIITQILEKFQLVKIEALDFLDIIYSEIFAIFEDERESQLESEFISIKRMIRNNGNNLLKEIELNGKKIFNKKKNKFEGLSLLGWALQGIKSKIYLK